MKSAWKLVFTLKADDRCVSIVLEKEGRPDNKFQRVGGFEPVFFIEKNPNLIPNGVTKVEG